MDGERPEDKIKRLMREAAPASNVADFASAARKRGRPVATPAPVVTITGNNNAAIAGSNNQVNITMRGRANPKLQATPGPEAISQAQAAELQELVSKVAAVTGEPHSKIWNAFKKRLGHSRLSSYLFLPASQFEEARAYLRRWVASKTGVRASTPSAARNTALARIHIEEKKVRGMKEQIRAYILDHYDARSLGDLTIEQLSQVIKQFRL